MNNSTTQLFDTAHVTIHPQLKAIPALAKDSPEFIAIALGVRESGFVTPLICDMQHRVMDDHSRTLLEVARRWQILEVPIVIRPVDEAPQIALHSLLHRRHLSKAALAFLAYPLVKPAFEHARKWRLALVGMTNEERKKGSIARSMLDQKWANNPEFSADLEETAYRNPADYAERLGVSKSYLEKAQEVHKIFEADSRKYTVQVFGGPADGSLQELTLREYFTPRILAPYWGDEHEQHKPMGLTAVLKAIPSLREDPQKYNPHGRDNQMELFTGAALMPLKRWDSWSALDPAGKKKGWEAIEAELDKLSEEEAEEFAARAEEAREFYGQLAVRCRRAGR